MLEIKGFSKYNELTELINKNNINRIFLVSTKSLTKLNSRKYLQKIANINNIQIILFQDFTPNPTYEDVVKGVKAFKKSKFQLILAIGGGSSIDVAKCIKGFSKMNKSESCLTQQIKRNDVPFVAIPTTAGTGSEETEFAVIYYKGEKKSIEHKSLKPDISILDEKNLETLPIYQREATMLDTLSHAIESFWSINSTKTSEQYSLKALKLLISNKDWYLKNDRKANKGMLIASNFAGKAINITKTTAGHAMCYKLTSLYGISHGHAAALINSVLFPYMLHQLDKNNCNDIRGVDFVNNKFQKLKNIFGSEESIKEFISSLGLYEVKVNPHDIKLLTDSVNIQRLKNNPMRFSETDIKEIYTELFEIIKRE